LLLARSWINNDVRNNCSEYFSSRLEGTNYVRRRFWVTNFRWEEGLFGPIEAATEFDAASYFARSPRCIALACFGYGEKDVPLYPASQTAG
jgi:hypothetical protein